MEVHKQTTMRAAGQEPEPIHRQASSGQADPNQKYPPGRWAARKGGWSSSEPAAGAAWQSGAAQSSDAEWSGDRWQATQAEAAPAEATAADRRPALGDFRPPHGQAWTDRTIDEAIQKAVQAGMEAERQRQSASGVPPVDPWPANDPWTH